jgi:hypothetical protein
VKQQCLIFCPGGPEISERTCMQHAARLVYAMELAVLSTPGATDAPG